VVLVGAHRGAELVHHWLRPRRRARPRTRKMVLVELTAKQIEDEHEHEDDLADLRMGNGGGRR
jgi:hypothetical protein